MFMDTTSNGIQPSPFSGDGSFDKVVVSERYLFIWIQWFVWFGAVMNGTGYVDYEKIVLIPLNDEPFI